MTTVSRCLRCGQLQLLKKEHTRIVCSKADHKVAIRPNPEGITTHGYSWEGRVVFRVVQARLFRTAVEHLEVVAVKMEGMLSWIVAVQHDLDDLIVWQDEGVRVAPVPVFDEED